jgi:MFS family permease
VTSLFSTKFVIAWWANLLQSMSFFMFVYFSVFLQELGAGEGQIGVIIASMAVAGIAVRPFVGRAMDRRGRRPVILAGGVANVIVMVLYLTVTSLGPWVYVVRVFHGFAEGALFTALFTYGADIIPPERRTQGLALFGVSGMLPLALSGVIGDLVLGAADTRMMFVVAAVLASASLALTLFLPESAVEARDTPPPVGTFRSALAQRDLYPIWWVTLVFAMSLTAYFSFLSVYVEATGTGTVAPFFGAYAGMAIGLRVFAGWLPDRLGPKPVLYPALGLVGAGFVVLAAGHGVGALALAGLLCGAGHGYAFPILYAFVVARSRERHLGSASAIFSGVFDLGSLLGSPILGVLIETQGYPAMFAAAAVWIGAGVVVFAWWDHRPVPELAPEGA